ncbi:MAG: oxidoreductase [Moraxellaceae bacterium]|nr:oxidoreductase [Moraxellaceae bacterium]
MRNVVIAGATGLVGQIVLAELLACDDVAQVHVLSRRPLPFTHSKMQVHEVDVTNLGGFSLNSEVDTAFNCLGTTIKKAGNTAAFRAVDQHAVFATAQLAKRAGATQFLSISAIGAHPKASMFYSRVKGEVEVALETMSFDRLVLLQPSLLTGSREEFRLGETLGEVVLKPLSLLMLGPLRKYRAISASTVAKAMVSAARDSANGVHRFTSEQMEALANRSI